MDSSQDSKTNPELDSFRNQWLSDLQSKKDVDSGPSNPQPQHHQTSSHAAAARKQQHRRPSSPTSSRKLPVLSSKVQDEEDDEAQGYLEGQAFDGPVESSGHTLADPETSRPTKTDGPASALDHYEEAMEKEAQGNMGESLKLYRKAYRLDHRVDKQYREKHFPSSLSSSKPGNPSSSSTTAAATTSSSSTQLPATTTEEDTAQPVSIEDLIASFSDLKVEPAPPIIEGTPPPPCPLAALPDELLVHILQDVAVSDVGDFARAALVCKHFAFIVAREQRIWRRVCVGKEFGFGGMHRYWQKTIEWEPLEALEDSENEDSDEEDGEDGVVISPREREERRQIASRTTTLSLTPSVYPTWKDMFHDRPRIRFNGCYISTVNYVRSGQASTNQATWGGAPILIVTYYRYLRLFRDGTAISLLHTSPPADIIHHLTHDMVLFHRDNQRSHLPSAVVTGALRGRWRLSSLPSPDPSSSSSTAAASASVSPSAPNSLSLTREQEADLCVETEGIGAKYMYRMDLSLRNAGKGTRSNKVVWRNFYSYNKLTDDWAEFQLKNDKPFFFSRVKSYGVGDV